MKFLYYLPAIGSPDLEIKLQILNHNLIYLYKNIGVKFDVLINCYDSYNDVSEHMKQYDFIENVYKTDKKGILTELWLTNEDNNKIHNYDYILFIFDDVIIENIDINELIEIKKKYNIDIISPKIRKSTYLYMNTNNGLTFTNALEIYCILLTPTDFDKYASLNSVENKYMWGVDLLFGHFKVKTAIMNKYSALHVLPSKSDNHNAQLLFWKYMNKNGFKTKNEIIQKYPYVINDLIDF